MIETKGYVAALAADSGMKFRQALVSMGPRQASALTACLPAARRSLLAVEIEAVLAELARTAKGDRR
jgi:hypothetical protein